MPKNTKSITKNALVSVVAVILAGCASQAHVPQDPSDVIPLPNKVSVSSEIGKETKAGGASVRQFVGLGTDSVGLLGKGEGNFSNGTYLSDDKKDRLSATNATGKISLGLYGTNPEKSVFASLSPSLRFDYAKSNGFLESQSAVDPGAELNFQKRSIFDEPHVNLTLRLSGDYIDGKNKFEQNGSKFDGDETGYRLEAALAQDLWAGHDSKTGALEHKLTVQPSLVFTDTNREINGSVGMQRVNIKEHDKKVSPGLGLAYFNNNPTAQWYAAVYGRATFLDSSFKNATISHSSDRQWQVGAVAGINLLNVLGIKDKDMGLYAELGGGYEDVGKSNGKGGYATFGLSLYHGIPGIFGAGKKNKE